MGEMIKIATIISFLTAPFYAVANLWLVSSKNMPEEWRPSLLLKIWSIAGILFLIGFGIWYLKVFF
jgi:Mn2+/Fe2+ NRAMP family transporter